MIDLAARQAAVRAAMAADGIATLLLAANGLHLIDQPDPVAHFSGFRSLGAALAVVRDNAWRLLVSPATDADRAAEQTGADCIGCDAIDDGLRSLGITGAAWVGLGAMPVRLARALAASGERQWDAAFDRATAVKTAHEIDSARRATVIAEAGFRHLLATARDGVRRGDLRECDLAVEVNLHMKALGANDSFLMLNALPRSPAIMPSSERIIRPGDVILAELSPSVDGQFVQICRTSCVGEPPTSLRADYGLLVEALAEGIAAVRPGVTVSTICDSIDARMAAAGHAAYSRPPHLRRRGHGLGCGSVWPGDVAFDNHEVLAPDMLFVVHPNQLLPGSGYMMCGEPMRVTSAGGEVLSAERSALAVVAL